MHQNLSFYLSMQDYQMNFRIEYSFQLQKERENALYPQTLLKLRWLSMVSIMLLILDSLK